MIETDLGKDCQMTEGHDVLALAGAGQVRYGMHSIVSITTKPTFGIIRSID
jgi:hypothetical protein